MIRAAVRAHRVAEPAEHLQELHFVFIRVGSCGYPTGHQGRYSDNTMAELNISLMCQQKIIREVLAEHCFLGKILSGCSIMHFIWSATPTHPSSSRHARIPVTLYTASAHPCPIYLTSFWRADCLMDELESRTK